MNSNCSYCPEMLNLGKNWWFSVLCDLEIRWMTLTNNRAPLLYATSKIWASFHSHLWIWSGVTVWKIPILGQNRYFLGLWPWNLTGNLEKTTGHLFYTTSIFMHHFIAICEFKPDIQSGNAQFGSKSMIFLALWLWNLTDDFQNQSGTAPKQYQALCIISSPYVKSN